MLACPSPTFDPLTPFYLQAAALESRGEILARLKEPYHPSLNKHFLDLGVPLGSGKSVGEARPDSIAAALRGTIRAADGFLKIVSALCGEWNDHKYATSLFGSGHRHCVRMTPVVYCMTRVSLSVISPDLQRSICPLLRLW